jgi:putative spermidine/putrescine transport system permease protein
MGYTDLQGEKMAEQSFRKRASSWLGILPFLLFCLAFEIMPIFIMVRDSLVNKAGEWTLVNYSSLGIPLYINSFLNSIKLSGITALIGTILGTAVGYVIYRLPSKRVREALTSLSDVTTNFAGAPLAFAFIIVLGSTGIITQFLKQSLAIQIYPTFSVYSFSGLVLAYVYFQLPLMVLLIIPAFAGLRKEWVESAQNLGASTFQFWWRIGLPILTPSLVAGMVLLFANAFGAYATAYTLTGSSLSLATIQIGFTITGEVRHDPGVGLAMAVISILIMGSCIAMYQWSTRQAQRWTGR